MKSINNIYGLHISTNFSTIGATIVVATNATGKLTDQALKNLLYVSVL